MNKIIENISAKELMNIYSQVEERPSFISIISYPNFLPKNFGINYDIFQYKPTDRPSEFLKFIDSEIPWDFILLHSENLPKETDVKALQGLKHLQPYARIGLLGKKNKRILTNQLDSSFFQDQGDYSHENCSEYQNKTYDIKLEKNNPIFNLEKSLVYKFRVKCEICLAANKSNIDELLELNKIPHKSKNEEWEDKYNKLDNLLRVNYNNLRDTEKPINWFKNIFFYP